MDNTNPNQPGSPLDPQTGRPAQSFDAPAESALPYSSPPEPYMPPAPQSDPGKKKGSAALTFSLAAVLVLVTAVVAGALLLNKAASQPTVAVERLLPPNTIAYLTMDTSIEGKQKEALDKMKEAFESQPGFKEAWAKIAEQAPMPGSETPSDITDFDSLSNYLGDNLTLAVLPPGTEDMDTLKAGMSGEGEGGSEAAAMDVLGRNLVGVVDLDFSPLNKKGPLLDLKNQADNAAKLEVAEKYRDIDIRKYVTDTTTLYFALLNGTSTAVVGGQVAPVRVLIDQFKDGKGLEGDARFTSLVGQVPQDRIATLYVNLGEAFKQAQSAAPEMLGSMAIQKAEGSMLLALSAQDDGMQLDVASEVNMEGMGLQMDPNARPDTSILSDVPAGTLTFLAGTDLKTLIQLMLNALRKQSSALGEGEDMVTSTLAEMEQATGLSLEQDILPWMAGDYVFSFVMSSGEQSSDLAPVLVFQMKMNEADGAKAMESVEKLVTSMSGASPEKLDTGDGTFYAVNPEMGAVIGGTKDRFIFVLDLEGDVASATARVKEVLGGVGKNLGNTGQWQAASGHLPKDSNLVYYLDLTGLRGLTERGISYDSKQEQEYEQTVAPFVRPFKYLTMGESSQAASEGGLSRSHTVIFLGIGK